MRSLTLSCASVMSGRRRPAPSFWTDADQQSRSPGDLFCSRAGAMQPGATKVWPARAEVLRQADGRYVTLGDRTGSQPMRLLTIALCATTIAAGSTPASAARFAPPGANFTIVGSLGIERTQSSNGFNCKVTLRGQITDTGKMKIKNASFCHRMQPYGLPWIWVAEQDHPPFALYHMAFSVNGGHDCGSIDSDVFFPPDGKLAFGSQFTSKLCFLVSGQATVSPTITIVH